MKLNAAQWSFRLPDYVLCCSNCFFSVCSLLAFFGMEDNDSLALTYHAHRYIASVLLPLNWIFPSLALAFLFISQTCSGCNAICLSPDPFASLSVCASVRYLRKGENPYRLLPAKNFLGHDDERSLKVRLLSRTHQSKCLLVAVFSSEIEGEIYNRNAFPALFSQFSFFMYVFDLWKVYVLCILMPTSCTKGSLERHQFIEHPLWSLKISNRDRM